MKLRNSNFELLRVMSIILILLMHTSSMADYIGFNELNSFLRRFISSIGNIGVSCFVLISGYFGVKFKLNKFIHIVYLTTLYTTLVYVLKTTTPIIDFNNYELLKSIIVIPLYKNWFITCYLILMILAPFIDFVVVRLDKARFKKILLILFVVFSLLPTLFNTPYYTVLTMGGKSLTYFMFIYLIGRYIKLNKDVLFRKKITLGVFLGATILINILNNTASYVFHKSINIYAMDCSPLILISSISVFYFFKSVKLQSKIINYISSSVLAVYLLDGARVFIDYYFFKINTYSKSNCFFAVLLIEVFFFFVIAITIDKLRSLILLKIEMFTIERLITSVKIKNNLFE